MKHVLVCPIGTSFNVVTETIWCLLQPDMGDPPDSVRVLTTQPIGHMGRVPLADAVDREGAPDIGERVLAAALERARAANEIGTKGKGGERIDAVRWLLQEKIDLLLREFGPPGHEIDFTLEVARRDDGSPLTDALLPEDGVAFEQRLLTLLMREVSGTGEGYETPAATTAFARDPDVRLSMTMAGGRKYFATAARLHITTVGAPGDRLFDLVSLPTGVEFMGLWWPGHFHDGADTAVVGGKETKGEARLAEIPWIPGNVTALGVASADPTLAQSYAQAMAADAKEERAVPIVFDVLRGTISCRGEILTAGKTKVASGKKEAAFTSSHFWLLAQLAILKLEGKGHYQSNYGPGWVTMSTILGVNERHEETAALQDLRDTHRFLNEFGPQDALREVRETAAKAEMQVVLDLRGFLPAVDGPAKSRLSDVLTFHPYLNARLALTETTVMVEMGGETKKRKAISLSANASEFSFIADGEPIDV